MGRKYEDFCDHHKKSRKRKKGHGNGNGHGNSYGNGNGGKKLIGTKVKKSAKKIVKVIEEKVFTVKKVKKFKVNLRTRNGGNGYGGGYGGGKGYCGNGSNGGGHKKRDKKHRKNDYC